MAKKKNKQKRARTRKEISKNYNKKSKLQTHNNKSTTKTAAYRSANVDTEKTEKKENNVNDKLKTKYKLPMDRIKRDLYKTFMFGSIAFAIIILMKVQDVTYSDFYNLF